MCFKVLEEIIISLIFGGLASVALTVILLKYRKPIDRGLEKINKGLDIINKELDEWSKEVRKNCEQSKRENNERTFAIIKKFVENVDEKNMTRTHLEIQKLISEIERTGVYPDNFPIRCYNILMNKYSTK